MSPRKPASPSPKPAVTPVRRRAPGRPSAADALDQRERLLDAALACFVERGIAATSLRDIAARAQVTPALLHYHHGDKARLVEALVEVRLLPALLDVQARVAAAGDDVRALVLAVVDGLFEAIRQRPWWPQLWVREVLCEGGGLRHLLTDQMVPPVARVVVARFRAAQQRGELNPGLDPRLLMTSLIGLTLFPAAGAPIWRVVLEADELQLDDVRRHALALIEGGAWPRTSGGPG